MTRIRLRIILWSRNSLTSIIRFAFVNPWRMSILTGILWRKSLRTIRRRKAMKLKNVWKLSRLWCANSLLLQLRISNIIRNWRQQHPVIWLPQSCQSSAIMRPWNLSVDLLLISSASKRIGITSIALMPSVQVSHIDWYTIISPNSFPIWKCTKK